MPIIWKPIDVAARHAAVQDVADDRDRHALEVAPEASGACVNRSSRHCVGCWCLPSPALMTLAVGVAREHLAGAGRRVTHDDDVGRVGATA